MGIELIIFILALLFGIFIYWRESNGNGLYRFINKILNNKALQMRADNPKGFVYQQPFIPRLLFVIFSLLIIGLVLQFLTPIKVFTNYIAISSFATFGTGTFLGTYLANFVLKSSKVLEEKSDSISEVVSEAVEKGKDFITDLKPKTTTTITEAPSKTNSEPITKANNKSARERLKDKGLM